MVDIVGTIKGIMELGKEKIHSHFVEGDGRKFFCAPSVGVFDDSLGREHIVKPNNQVSVIENRRPMPETVELNTLKGICDLAHVEGLDCHAVINGPRSVSLVSEFDEKWKLRDIYARASITDNEFPFKRELDIETFIVNLQCHFVDTPEKRKVIDFVSSIFASEVKRADDNGIAQNVVVETTVGRKAKVEMDPIVRLRPWRTFREIEQPEDTFLLRAHYQEKGLPLISLRSAGGDLWEHTAIESIADFIRSNLPDGVEVIR